MYLEPVVGNKKVKDNARGCGIVVKVKKPTQMHIIDFTFCFECRYQYPSKHGFWDEEKQTYTDETHCNAWREEHGREIFDMVELE